MARIAIRAAVLAALCIPGTGKTLGLGAIEVHSGLNQRLDAEIELVGADPADLERLVATVASREAFTSAGMEYPQAFDSIRIQARRNQQGRVVLHVTSSRSIAEPITTLVIQADWSRGRMQRTYTLLLDPPGFGAQSPSATVAAPAGVADDQRVVRVPPGVSGRGALRSPPLSSPRPSIAPGSQYGPVTRGESLWKIAARVRPVSADLQSTMAAIYRANPQAFAGGMNLLMEGAVLAIPAASAISAPVTVAKLAESTEVVSATAGSPATVPPVPESTEVVSAATRNPAARLAEEALSGADPLSELRRQVASTRARNDELQAELDLLNSSLASTAELIARREAEIGSIQAELANLRQDQGSVGVREAAAPALPIEADQRVLVSEAASVSPARAAAGAASQGNGLFGAVLGAVLGFVFGVLVMSMTLARRRDAARAAQEPGDTAASAAASAQPTARPVSVAPLAASGDADVALADGASVRPVDAIAEADALLGYRMHAQAAQIVGEAVRQHPASMELKAKLLEVHFAASSPQDFADAAHAYQASLRGHTEFWERAAAMGRHLCPNDPLFAVHPADVPSAARPVSGGVGAAVALAASPAADTPEAGLDSDDDLHVSMNRNTEYDSTTIRARIVSDKKLAGTDFDREVTVRTKRACLDDAASAATPGEPTDNVLSPASVMTGDPAGGRTAGAANDALPDAPAATTVRVAMGGIGTDTGDSPVRGRTPEEGGIKRPSTS